VLLPEPVLPGVEELPEEEGVDVEGVDVEGLGVDGLVLDVPPEVAPPLVIFSSLRHFSRSVPVMPRHLLLVAPVELPAELGEELLLPVALGDEVLGEELLGEELLLPVALGEELLPDAPEAPPEALSGDLLSVALDPLLAPPAAPVDEPELCAIEALDKAKSAAAVAALMSFNVIGSFLPYLVVPDAPPVLLPEPMPDPLLPAPEPLLEPPVPLPGVVGLVPDFPAPEVLPLPDVPPAAAPPLDLKYASHS
jgi:hypothetical protein